MQKIADAIEEIGRYVEALEKTALRAPTREPATVEPATVGSPNRDYGALLPKLAARLDLEEEAVKTELSKLSDSVLGELSKLATDDGNTSGVSLGSVSDFVDPCAPRKKTAASSKEAYENFTNYLLKNR